MLKDYKEFLDKYTGDKSKVNNPDKPAGTAWTAEEIAEREGMPVEQIRAWGEYYHSVGNTAQPPDFTPKPPKPPDPSAPIADHTGEIIVGTNPFGGPIYRKPEQVAVVDLTAAQLKQLIKDAVKECL